MLVDLAGPFRSGTDPAIMPMSGNAATPDQAQVLLQLLSQFFVRVRIRKENLDGRCGLGVRRHYHVPAGKGVFDSVPSLNQLFLKQSRYAWRPDHGRNHIRDARWRQALRTAFTFRNSIRISEEVDSSDERWKSQAEQGSVNNM